MNALLVPEKLTQPVRLIAIAETTSPGKLT